MPKVKPDYEKIKAKLKSHGAKLRAGAKIVIDTESGETTALPVIEIKLPRHPTQKKYAPLNIAGTWHYKTIEARDKVLAAIKA